MVNKELILITGNQNRHLSIAAEIIDNYKVTWIRYKRKLVPQATEKSSEFLNIHLKNLIDDEKAAIGYYEMSYIEKKSNIHQIIDVSGVDEFNQKSFELIKDTKLREKATLIYGSGIIREKLMNILPKPLINIHGGISPYFKGSSTLLYALALCQPELLGMTIHEIDSGIDSGDIYCHLLPKLETGMTPTQMFAACQKILVEKISKVMSDIISGKLEASRQARHGRTFMERDYRETILKIIYEMHKKGAYDESINNLESLRKKYKLKTC